MRCRIVRGHVASGNDIGKKDGLIVIHFLGKLHQSDVGERNTGFLGLQSIE